jgi:hypothetical protein
VTVTTSLVIVALVVSACDDDGGSGRTFECQTKCHNADELPAQGFDSYTITNASDEQVAEGRCIEMATQDIAGACGAGNTFDNECACAPASP